MRSNVQASPERLEEIEDRLAALDRLKRKYRGDDAGGGDRVWRGGGAEAGGGGESRCAAGGVEGAGGGGGGGVSGGGGGADGGADGRRRDGWRSWRRRRSTIWRCRCGFKVEVTAEKEQSGWTAHGWDQVECLIATNAGEPLKPLEEIASGGEMSRVMLALKVTVEESFAAAAQGRRKKTRADPRTLVFDEIDIGIGGRAAEAVGRKLKTLSKRQQVVCITHLPQIAAFADQHFLIEKTEKGGRTRTEIRRMEEAERDAGGGADVERGEADGDEPGACAAVAWRCSR